MNKAEALQYLEKWLKGHSEPDDKRYYIGGQMRSARELVEEVRSGTDIGEDYLKSVMDLAEKGRLP